MLAPEELLERSPIEPLPLYVDAELDAIVRSYEYFAGVWVDVEDEPADWSA